MAKGIYTRRRPAGPGGRLQYNRRRSRAPGSTYKTKRVGQETEKTSSRFLKENRTSPPAGKKVEVRKALGLHAALRGRARHGLAGTESRGRQKRRRAAEEVTAAAENAGTAGCPTLAFS